MSVVYQIFAGAGGGSANFISASGNTAGVLTTFSSGVMVLAGGNNITLSQNSNTITISGAAQTVQTLGLYGVGNTTGQSSSSTRDARSLSFDGAGIVSVGMSGGSVVISATQSDAAQTNQTLGLYGVGNTTGQSSSTTVDARTLSFDGAGVVSVGYSAGSVIISAPAAAADGVNIVSASGNTTGTLTTFSTGTIVLAGGNNITLSQSSNTITISGAAGGGAGSYNIVSASGNTTGTLTTFSTGTMVIAGGNNITLSQSSNTITISGAAFPAQTNQTLGLYGVGNTTGQSSSTTVDARTLSFDGAGLVSVGYSAGSIIISATQSDAAQTNQTLGLYGVGNTTGQSSSTTVDARTLSFDGAGLVSVGYSAGSVIISATQSDAAQTNQTLGLYGVGNTTGQSSSTTVDARTLSFDGAGIVSVGMSGGSVIISATDAAQTNQTLGLYGVGNTTGQSSSSTIDARSLSFDGAGIASVGMSGGSVVISVPAGGGGFTNSYVEFPGYGNLQLTSGSFSTSSSAGGSGFHRFSSSETYQVVQQLVSGSLYLCPVPVENNQVISRANMFAIASNWTRGQSLTASTSSTQSTTFSAGLSYDFLLYSQGSAGSTSAIFTVASTQLTMSIGETISESSNSFTATYSIGLPIGLSNTSSFSTGVSSTTQSTTVSANQSSMSGGNLTAMFSNSQSTVTYQGHDATLNAATLIELFFTTNLGPVQEIFFPFGNTLTAGGLWFVGIRELISGTTNMLPQFGHMVANNEMAQSYQYFGATVTNKSLGPHEIGAGVYSSTYSTAHASAIALSDISYLTTLPYGNLVGYGT